MAEPAHTRNASSIEYSASSVRKKLDDKLKGSLYRHVGGKEPRELCDSWYKLNPAAGNCYLSQSIKCNAKFWAMPTKLGNGSTLMVQDIAKPGRASEKPFCIRGHKAMITAFSLSPLDTSLCVTASQDGVIKVWSIPAGGLTADITECQAEFQAKGKVTVLRLSEVVDGVLAVGSTGPEGHIVQVWDLKNKEEYACIEGFHDDSIVDIQFDQRGLLMATSAKDGLVRVLDIRSKDVVCELKVRESLRDTQLVWVSDDLLLVYGAGKGSKRSLSMWNIRTQEEVETKAHDTNSATFLGHYDHDMQVLFTANNGGTNMEIWQLQTQKPHIALLNTYQSPSMFQGSCFQPKLASVDAKAVQVARSFKLCMDRVIPIVWTVPRKRLEFFQDDIFPDTWDGKALCSSTEWFNGKLPEGGEKNYVSLQPAGMDLLSTAPAEELTVRQQRYNAHQLKETAPKKKGVLGHESAEEVAEYFTQVAKEMPKTNRFDATYDDNALDVDEDEWD